MTIFDRVYLAVSFSVSLFYGLFAVKIFFEKKDYETLTRTKKIREIIFNFFGVAIGFLVLYYLIKKAFFSISENKYDLINIIDVLLLIIALLGISGYLPSVAYTITSKVGDLLDKIGDLLSSKKKDK